MHEKRIETGNSLSRKMSGVFIRGVKETLAVELSIKVALKFGFDEINKCVTPVNEINS